jgi:hypothetical protein
MDFISDWRAKKKALFIQRSSISVREYVDGLTTPPDA